MVVTDFSLSENFLQIRNNGTHAAAYVKDEDDFEYLAIKA